MPMHVQIRAKEIESDAQIAQRSAAMDAEISMVSLIRTLPLPQF